MNGNGDFWMFGGVYSNFLSVVIYHNDLWRFVPRLKAWEQVRPNGSSSFGQNAYLPPPISRRPALMPVADPEGNLWLFGDTADTSTSGGIDIPDCWNDLWKFDITTRQWTWIIGSNTQNAQNQITAPAQSSSREVPLSGRTP